MKHDYVLLDQIHLDLMIPSGLSEEESETIRQSLAQPKLLRRLRRRVRRFLRKDSVFQTVRIRISR